MGRNDLFGIPKLANSRLETNTNARVGEVALSPSVGSGSTTTSTSAVAISGCLLTLVTTGRPVLVGFTGDGSFNTAILYGDNNGSGSEFSSNIIIQRDGIEIARYQFDIATVTQFILPASALTSLDMPGAGTHTYQAFMFAGGAAAVKHADLRYCRMFAVEL